MTRVTDEDLEAVAEACRVDSRIAFEANERLRAELLVLRKVADAAMRFIDYGGRGMPVKKREARDQLDVALRDAGL